MTQSKSTTLPPEFGMLLLVSFLVSFANEISHGQYLGPALACLACALTLLVWLFSRGMAAPAPRPVTSPMLLLVAIWCALASMPVTALLDPKIVVHAHTSLSSLRALQVAAIPLLLTYLPFLGDRAESQAVRHSRFALFGALTAAAGIAIIHISPAPGIDTWDLQMHGAQALLRGENPYVTVAVPDTTPIHPYPYVPYVYAPGTLYVGAIGWLLGGDVRYAMLIALVASGVALRTITRTLARGASSPLPSLVEDAPALFVWLMPPLAFIIELSWTDPVQLALICAAVVANVRGRALLSAIVVGLAIESKQSMVWLIPLASIAFGYRVREWLAMLATAALAVVPFAVADSRALKHDTIDLMLGLVPRDDALGVAVWYKSTFGSVLPWTAISTAAAVATVGATVVCALSLAPGRPGERAALFGRAVALTYFTFFFFAKWAFANYYFLISGLTALAAAASLGTLGRKARPAAAGGL